LNWPGKNSKYLIEQNKITATSFVQSDDNVIKKLKLMGDRIIKQFDLEKGYLKLNISNIEFEVGRD